MLYEWREASGTAVYPQWPPRAGEGALVRTLDLNPPADAQRATAERVALQSSPAAPASPRVQASAAGVVGHALAALQRAERIMGARKAPRPGERQHLVNGHSRLTSAYFDRIHALQAAVAAARAGLRAAYAARDALVP